MLLFRGMLIAAAAAWLGAVPAAALATNPTQTPSSRIIEATNAERSRAGLPPLKADPKLMKAAQMKANDMARQSYFNHESPQGVTLTDLLARVRYAWRACAENIAVSSRRTENFVAGWMRSSGHRRNILSSRYKQIGAATAVGTWKGRPAVYAVQEFGAQR